MPQSLSETNLFKPIQVGPVTLKNRLVHAPTTRFRNTEDFVATDSMLNYYTQRAENNGGLIIVEGTVPSPATGLYSHQPMINTPQQVAAWKKIVQSVHDKGTSISMQLFGVGSVSDPKLTKRWGFPLVSASEWYTDEASRAAAEQAENPVHALTVEEIHNLVKEFGSAAKRCVEEAGFDLVEVHGANMYLLEHFLNPVSNHRTDEYGGSLENRSRVLLQVIDSVIDAVGAEHTAVRLSPYSTFQGGEGVHAKVNPVVTHGYILSELEKRAKNNKRVAYVSFVEPRIAGNVDQEIPEVDTSWVNEIWKGVIIRAGALLSDQTYTQLKSYVNGDDRTLIGASRFFTSNPDLAERLKKGLPLTHYDRSLFYTNDNAGYTTWSKYGEDSIEVKGTPKPLA